MKGGWVVVIVVRLFAVMAQQAEMSRVKLEMRDGATVGEVEGAVRGRLQGVRWLAGTMLAVNQAYVGAGHVLKDGDEVAIIPPVSGG